MTRRLRAAFVTGLIVTVPIVATFLALRFLFETLDGLLGPSVARLAGRELPGLGLLLTLILVVGAGFVARSLLGRRLVRLGERLIDRVPVARSIYRASREIVETATLSKRQVFREVVMIEYPRPGLYSYGFVTAYTSRDDVGRLAHVFIPGPPVPTTGILVAVPEAQLFRLDLSVEEALKLILSGGMLTPARLEELTGGDPARSAEPTAGPGG